MICIEDSKIDVRICGEDNLTSLMIRLCAGYWLLRYNPEEYDKYVQELPIDNLTVKAREYNVGEYILYAKVIRNKKFFEEDYDNAMREIKTFSANQKLSSPYVDVQVNGRNMEIIITYN